MGTKPTLTSAQAVAGNNVIDISYPSNPEVRGEMVVRIMRAAAERTGHTDLVNKIDSAANYSEQVTAIGIELNDIDNLTGEWRDLILAALRVLPIDGEFNDDGAYWASFINHVRAVAP